MHLCEIICGRKSTCMTQTNILTKTTQIWGFSKLRVKIKKKSVISTYSIFQHVYGRHNLVSFYGESYFDSRIASSFYILFFFFSEKTLGDISFKLETKIMNFMTFFFRKKYNQVNSSVVNNMQCNLFTIFPLSGPFAEFGFVFIHYITYFRF